MALQARLAPVPSGEQRRAKRTRIDLEGDLRLPAIADFAARILNISDNGFLAECEAPFTPGSRLRLTLTGIGVIDARVVWQRGSQLGCAFVSRISGEFCQAAIRAGRLSAEEQKPCS